MKKLTKQILCIVALSGFFISFNASIFFTTTYRFINDFNGEMQAKSVEVSKFLPFDKDSGVVRKEGEKLTGELPVIDGAAALFPLFSSYVYRLYPESSIKYENNDFTVDSKLVYSNTRGAYKGIVDGTRDIIFGVAPSKEQLEYASSKGVELQLTPIGHEAFVFLNNIKNPVKSLTKEQIKGMYSGKITSWKEVGGDNRIVCPVSRNKGSGSQTTMEKFMQGEKMVSSTPFALLGQSIGFSFRYYVEGLNSSSKVKMISVDGIEPSKENIQNGTYPIISDIYMITRKGETNHNVQLFKDYVLSEEGQAILEEVGYVGV